MVTTHHDVIVIGAGLAGLRCAIDLVAAGREVVVLEARDRVGGRVFTHRFDNGQICERGAEFVDVAHTSVLALAAELGLAVIEVTSGLDDDLRFIDIGGRTTAYSLHHSLAGDLARWTEALATLAATIDLDDPASTPDATRLDVTPLSALIDELDLSLVARVVIGRDVRSEHMVGPDRVSLLAAARSMARSMTGGDRAVTGARRLSIVGGNSGLASGLAARLGERIRLSTPVATIEADTGRVVLESGAELIATDIVAALPVPVLGRLWWEMPFEIATLAYGMGGKVSVQVDRRIWRDHGCDGSVRTERAWGEIWESAAHQTGDSGVLTALLSSHDGAAMLTLPETPDRIVDEMERLFPGLRGLAGERVLTDWTNDLRSLGSSVTFGPGELLAAWDALRARYGRMVLAGEHTDGWSGSMEGALRSGRRAATAVLDG